MTDAQKRFCDEYLTDLNATRAYKVAYLRCKKDETANVNGSKLLRNAKVQEYISEKMKEREKRTEITQDMVIKETAGAISSLETLEEYEGYGDDREKIGDTQKVKLLDKTKALELLGRHLGIFNDKIDVNVKEKEEKKNAISDILNQMQSADDV